MNSKRYVGRGLENTFFSGTVRARFDHSRSSLALAESRGCAGTLTIAMTVRRASVISGSFVEFVVNMLAVGNADTFFTYKSKAQVAPGVDPLSTTSERYTVLTSI
jgi:hypothetical protein